MIAVQRCASAPVIHVASFPGTRREAVAELCWPLHWFNSGCRWQENTKEFYRSSISLAATSMLHTPGSHDSTQVRGSWFEGITGINIRWNISSICSGG